MRRTGLYAGAGVAIAAGLFMGAAMRPNLDRDDRPAGPQVVENWLAQPTGPFDDGFAAYRGKLPDYVFGTDAGRAFTWPEQQIAAASPAPPPIRSADTDATDDASYSHPAYDDDAPAPAPSYPSESGDTVGHGVDASAVVRQPPPAPATANIESDAPPEATGDTTTG